MANHPHRSQYKCQHGLTLASVCGACAHIPGPGRGRWEEHPVPTLAEAEVLAPRYAAALRATAKRFRALSGQRAAGDIVVLSGRGDVPEPEDNYMDNVDCVWPAEVEARAWLEMIDYRWVQRRYPGGYTLRWRIAGTGGAMSTTDYETLYQRVTPNAYESDSGDPSGAGAGSV